MDFGVNLMTRGITGDAEGLLAMARQAEALGFAHVTANDHLVVPTRIASRYPYTESGEWPGARAGACLKQITVLGFLAGVTSAVRLVTSVMVVPQRPAVLAAKALTTLVDVLSRGRPPSGSASGGWTRRSSRPWRRLRSRNGRGDRRVPRRLQGAVDERGAALLRALRRFADIASSPGPRRHRTRQSGWAARARWCAAPRGLDGDG